MQRLGIRLEVIVAVAPGTCRARARAWWACTSSYRFEEEARAALLAWGEHVQVLLRGEGHGKVVPLRRPA